MSNSTQIQALQLAEQINDEFLTCKICYEHYKEPKCLSCLHTFCEECIEQHVNAQRSYKYTDYREFSCPICRKKTVIPSGGVRKLNDNFLISSLNELLLSKKPSKTPLCDICKIINQREREATSKCVECQKLMCRSCMQTHQTMKITTNHSIYELEIEKDIMCKQHTNEQVRFYCEQCELCVCVPCTYTDHRDHDLVDFKQGISHHKETIEENLRRCRQKMGELRNRLELVRACETRILYAQNEIHSSALNFVDTIRQREKALIEELDEYYGDETTEYLKKDDLETFLDQLKSTCNLTEMVVKGKDIELLLLKKQLCEKFDEFQAINLDPIPKNIIRKVTFLQGSVNLGKLEDPEENEVPLKEQPLNTRGIAACITAQGQNSFDSSTQDEDLSNEVAKNEIESDKEYEEAEEELEDIAEVDEEVEVEVKEMHHDKSTQIGYRDLREILGERIRETEVQTDIRMIHDLAAPSRTYDRRAFMASRTDSKEVQTDPQQQPQASQPQTSQHPALTSQSSIDDDTSPNAPVDRNKLGRRVRRHVKPGCSIAVLPNSEIIIIDPESNCVSILDRRGKFRYGMSNSNKPSNETGHQPSSVQFNSAVFANLAKLERGVRILTPQGVLTVKLDNEVLHEVRHVSAPVNEQAKQPTPQPPSSPPQKQQNENLHDENNQTNGHCSSDTEINE